MLLVCQPAEPRAPNPRTVSGPFDNRRLFEIVAVRMVPGKKTLAFAYCYVRCRFHF